MEDIAIEIIIQFDYFLKYLVLLREVVIITNFWKRGGGIYDVQ
jgi:hypothetical protein